ncbi:MAG: TlpA family protein disulfide reductase [Chitinophagaceae bacterium]|nr:TlpA family protein disulfide reductase [Chitinophagaceae bacterium]
MKIQVFIILSLVCSQSFAQIEWNKILNSSMSAYFKMKTGAVVISSAHKNVLKNDTNYYFQRFLYSIDSQKLGKLSFSEGDGFSIYINSKTYYFYSNKLTYYVADNSSYNHLKFLPYWDPGSFFFEYMSLGKKYGVDSRLDTSRNQIVLNFTNNTDGNFTLCIDAATYRVNRYIEIYTHKKFGNQYKEYSFLEEPLLGVGDSILQELDQVSMLYTRMTDEMISNADKEYAKNKRKIVGKKINILKLRENLFNEIRNSAQEGTYILLDFFYQSCLPCIKAIPELNQIRSRFATDKLVIVGVDPLPNDVGQKEKFIQRHHVSYPVVDGQQALSIKNISLPGLLLRYPTLVLIKPDGTIEKILDYYSPAHFRELNAYFKEVF